MFELQFLFGVQISDTCMMQSHSVLLFLYLPETGADDDNPITRT